jgi:multidrug resistance protein, MATE family
MSAGTLEEMPLVPKDEQDDPNMTLKNMRQEISTLFSLAWPVVITNVLNYSITSVSVFSLGHIDTNALAAISLASLLVNTTGLCVAQGLASALDTLCSQSFTGSSDYYAVGKHLQRAIIVSIFLCIPISIMWLFAEQILLSFGQDPDISKISGLFIRWMIPGLFPVFLNESLKRYLQAQGIMKPSMYLTAISAIMAVFLQWLLVWSDTAFNLGVVGAPISTSLVNIFTPLATVFYMYFIEGGERFGKWSWQEALDFKKLKDIFILGIPGTFMVVSEWYQVEFTIGYALKLLL